MPQNFRPDLGGYIWNDNFAERRGNISALVGRSVYLLFVPYVLACVRVRVYVREHFFSNCCFCRNENDIIRVSATVRVYMRIVDASTSLDALRAPSERLFAMAIVI